MTEPGTAWAEQELKEAKVAADLSEGRQRYTFLADTMPLIIWTARPDGGVDYYNRAWFDFTGLTLAQTADWGWGAVLHPDDLVQCVERWTHSFTTGENYEIEYRFKRGSDGTYRWFLGRAAARRNEAGEIVQWVGTCTDIDDKKRTESELLLVRSELEHRVVERTAELALTNERLQRKQTELRVLFDLMPAMIWFKDTENRILRVNQRVAENVGKRIAEIEGKPSAEIYPHDADRFYADDLTVIRSAMPKLGYVESVRDPEGREVWVQTDKVPYFDQDGKVIGIVVMAQDITARKRTDEALRESEERFSGAFEFASIGMALVSPEGRWLKVNRALCSLLGYSAAELLTRTFQDVTYPEDLEKDLGYLRRTIAGEFHTYQMEKRYIHAKGQVITVLLNVSLVRDAQGRPSYLISQIQDITERKRVEESLRLLGSAVEQTKESILITDAQLDLPGPAIIFVNPAFTQMTGYTAEEVIGKTPRILQGPRTERAVLSRLRQNLAQGDAFVGEAINYRKDGQEFVLEWQVAPLRNVSGKITHFVAIQRDISDRKRDEEEMRALHAQMQQWIDHAPVVLYRLKVEGEAIIPVMVSENISRLLGFTVKETVSYDWWLAQLHPEDRARAVASLPETLNTGASRTEYRLRHKDGSYHWVEDNRQLICDAAGKPAELVGVWLDITERKRAEELLRLSEAEFRDLAEAMPHMVWITRPDGWNTYISQQWMDYTGLTLEESLGHGWNKPFHPQDQQRSWESWQQATATVGIYSIECRLRRADGVYRWWLIRGVPQLDASGQVSKWFGTCTDIHEMKQAELEISRSNRALRESNDKFELLANHITDAFWIRSPDLKTVHYVSPAFERIWGRSVESLYANPREWVQFIMPEDRVRVLASFDALTGDTPSLDVEYRIVRPSGEVRWVHVRGFRVVDAAGKMISHTGIVTDITKRRQADEALRESEERYRSLIENARDAIFTIASDGTFISLNPAVEAMAGLSRADWIGKPFAPMVHPDDLPLAVEMFQRIMQGGHVPVHELRGNPALHRPALMEMTLAPLLNGVGKIIGVLGIGRDITERKQLEVQLYQSQKMESIGKLAGGVAHEFNSIMTAIIGQSDLLLDELPVKSGSYLKAVEIRNAANRAAILTQQLLAYGRKQQFQPAILDLNVVLAGMEGTLRNLLGRNVAMIIVPGAGLDPVKADAAQIEQVIINMAVNADDAMPDGGSVSFETTNVTPSPETVHFAPELKTGEYVMLTITDTGIGMTEAVKALIFEPFFTTKGAGEGSGLGLSTCHGIIKQSGGYISVSSEPGQGSTFRIYLPKAARVAAPPVRPPSVSRSGKETILLVEGNRELRDMSTNFLRQLGYTVSAAANRVEAINLNRLRVAGPIDLLLTESVLPQTSRDELSEQMKMLYPNIKVLLTVANSASPFANRDMLSKGVSILLKPFTPSALVQKVREVLDQPVH